MAAFLAYIEPVPGRLYPLVPTLVELKRRGHRVAVRTGVREAELLHRIGIEAGCDADTLWVQGGSPRAAVVETHDDHRIAMSFAVAGLKTPGIVILDETCVQKSFPTFWETFDGLYG